MEIKVQIELGATKELTSVLRQIASALCCTRTVEVQTLTTEKEVPTDEPEQKQEDKPAAEEAHAEKKKAGEKKKAEEKTTCSLDDVRKAMDDCHTRFEGEDWKNNTESDAYVKYHKKLNAWFKYLASFYGADRPSSLAEENRHAFIKDCEETLIGEDGNFMTERLSEKA